MGMVGRVLISWNGVMELTVVLSLGEETSRRPLEHTFMRDVSLTKISGRLKKKITSDLQQLPLFFIYMDFFSLRSSVHHVYIVPKEARKRCQAP